MNEPAFKNKYATLYCSDCLDILKEMPDESVDCIITDPPYGIDYKSNHSKDKKYRERIYDYDWDNPDFDIRPFFKEMWRVLKNNSDMYIFGCFKNYEVMKELGFKTILIWNKIINNLGSEMTWARNYELIYYFVKGKKDLRSRSSSVISVYAINAGVYGAAKQVIQHPTQKPIGVIEPLLLNSTKPNDLILDCFMGSGSTGVACVKYNRRFIGIDKDERYVEIAKKRIIDSSNKLFIEDIGEGDQNE